VINYVAPYDKTHIIGVGKETASNELGGVSTKGLKLALFDVSDVEHPKQIDKVEIGDSGTDSAALSDHRAFLFDKNKNLLVIPVRVVKTIDVPEKYSGDQQRIC
jgi:inhibitor of cysteine peptidase